MRSPRSHKPPTENGVGHFVAVGTETLSAVSLPEFTVPAPHSIHELPDQLHVSTAGFVKKPVHLLALGIELPSALLLLGAETAVVAEIR